MTFQIPAKTFLAGEYWALRSQQGIVLCTQPFFEMEVQKTAPPLLGSMSRASFSLEFHSDSPAGRFLEKHLDFFFHYQVTFRNPFKIREMGGVGSSTAEFLFLHRLRYPKGLLGEVWQSYQECLGETPGSGVDLLAQATGGLCIVNKMEVVRRPWPFEDLSFLTFFTGKKWATHEHLDKIKDNFAISEEFREAYENVLNSFLEGSSQALVDSINQYHNRMNLLDCLAPHTQELVKGVKKLPEVCAAKGCGAMGADVMLVLVPRKKREALKIQILNQLFQGSEEYFLASEGDLR